MNLHTTLSRANGSLGTGRYWYLLNCCQNLKRTRPYYFCAMTIAWCHAVSKYDFYICLTVFSCTIDYTLQHLSTLTVLTWRLQVGPCRTTIVDLLHFKWIVHSRECCTQQSIYREAEYFAGLCLFSLKQLTQ